MTTFPKDFLWGAAASAPQTEGAANQGGKSATTWDYWYQTDPARFYNQVGPQETSNVYFQYRQDAQLMKEMGFNSYRTSISWARLLPDGKTINPIAVDFYREYFATLRQNGVQPIVNLFHFDMPWWLMELGGWESRESVAAFEHYAKSAFLAFSDLVTHWTTFNEPMVHIECGYLGEAHYPGIFDFKKAIQVGYHTIMAHTKAVAAFKALDIPDGQIGCILNLSPVYAKSDEPADLEAKNKAELIYIRSLLDPLILGEFPAELVAIFKESHLLPATLPGDLALIKANSLDFLGVNYYQPLRVQAQRAPRFPIESPGDLAKGYHWPEKRINPHRGWEIYPEGLFDIAMKIKEDYDNLPWFASENGMGVANEEQFQDDSGIVLDDYRIDFIHEHLVQLQRGIAAGSNCFGYHLWTFVDCWSWLNAYKNRYGLYRVDLTDNFKRTPKKSAEWFAKVIQRNALD